MAKHMPTWMGGGEVSLVLGFFPLRDSWCNMRVMRGHEVSAHHVWVGEGSHE